MRVITKVMNPNGSFLELGPGSFSLSDHFADVTLLDKNKEVLKEHAAQKRKTLYGDYHSLNIPHDSFDYVVAIHPNLYDSQRSLEWLDSEKTCFRFRNSSLENFVFSLLNIARKKVFIASKAISDNVPFKKFAKLIAPRPLYFVVYEKIHKGDKK